MIVCLDFMSNFCILYECLDYFQLDVVKIQLHYIIQIHTKKYSYDNNKTKTFKT